MHLNIVADLRVPSSDLTLKGDFIRLLKLLARANGVRLLINDENEVRGQLKNIQREVRNKSFRAYQFCQRLRGDLNNNVINLGELCKEQSLKLSDFADVILWIENDTVEDPGDANRTLLSELFNSQVFEEYEGFGDHTNTIPEQVKDSLGKFVRTSRHIAFIDPYLFSREHNDLVDGYADGIAPVIDAWYEHSTLAKLEGWKPFVHLIADHKKSMPGTTLSDWAVKYEKLISAKLGTSIQFDLKTYVYDPQQRGTRERPLAMQERFIYSSGRCVKVGHNLSALGALFAQNRGEREERVKLGEHDRVHFEEVKAVVSVAGRNVGLSTLLSSRPGALENGGTRNR